MARPRCRVAGRLALLIGLTAAVHACHSPGKTVAEAVPQSSEPASQPADTAAPPAERAAADPTLSNAEPTVPAGAGVFPRPGPEPEVPTTRNIEPVHPAPPASAPAERPAAALPDQDRFYDPSNPAYALLQKANNALAGFPLDPDGNVDWVRALADGRIEPRASVTGAGAMRRDTRDIIMRDTKAMPYVKFPHTAHTEWLDCSNCHDAIFVPVAGANDINMDAIFRGRYCGVCHDKVAFSTYVCDRCHSVPGPMP